MDPLGEEGSMMCRAAVPVVALVLLVAAAGVAMAGDIVTVPTANQVKAGEVDLAVYYLGLDNASLPEAVQPLNIEFVRAQTAYIGLTDKLEIDVHRYDVDVLGVKTIFNATWVLQEETLKRPIVVVGGRDLSREYAHTSYFVSAAKTLNPPVGGPPTKPIIRLHLSLGTEDNTLLGEGRHEGIFGGVQALLRPTFPQVGLVALYDGTVVPKPKWPTMKGGTFGGHWWIGMSYTFNAKS
jgi:hypothetical protein